MIALLYPAPLVLGAILLAIGLACRERILRVSGDLILVIGCIIMVYQVYMVHDYTSYIITELRLETLTEYLGFIGTLVVAGILAGDGLLQLFPKKSSSS